MKTVQFVGGVQEACAGTRSYNVRQANREDFGGCQPVSLNPKP